MKKNAPMIGASLLQSILILSLKNVDPGSLNGSLQAEQNFSSATTRPTTTFYSYIKIL